MQFFWRDRHAPLHHPLSRCAAIGGALRRGLVADLRYAGQGAVLFLDSDFAPGLRWEWCDEVSDAICPTGWFTDPGEEDETIRGIVMRLPHGRGFLAGWSMGEGMPSVFDKEIHHDETDAAHAADNMSERAAERAREYQEEMDAEFVEA
ncbi:hypothetical protein [Thioalkalivibrio sp. ALE23]|uniref:hypothetical protein n=1 Tax=Thioalkalivibrio sp. ALE23 TaxID=1265495 RepID=UPI0012DE57C0|nr:hypothetical protein [Thioalkalivibrio sp. ALE23]